VAAWSDVGIASVGIVGTVVGVVTTALLAARQSRADRKESAEQERVERIAQVLGSINTLLIDLLPARVVVNINRPADVIRHRNQEWVPLRAQWEVALVVEPSLEVREAMREVEASIENIYSRLPLAISPGAGAGLPGGRGTFYDAAVVYHTNAVNAAEYVTASLHGQPGVSLPPAMPLAADPSLIWPNPFGSA
jgi:hypothetical protein